jgi:hypothetical protein
MSEKYVAFLPAAWDFRPEAADVEATIDALLSAEIIVGDRSRPESLRNGPGYQMLFNDTDPKPAPEGEGMGCDPGKMTVRIDQGGLRGYAGDNLEPVACAHCNSELPYDAAQDAFIALAEGASLEDERMQMECFHCGESNPAVSADFGGSGRFAHFALIFTGETSNRVEPHPEGLRLLEEKLRTPIKFVQIFGW